MANDELTGRTLDSGIELIEELGKEGLGHIYLGLDAAGRRYRVKVLTKEASLARKRFARELEAARTLTHPRLIPMVGDGEVEGQPYIVFDHVEGVSLTDHLQQAAPLPVDHAVAIAQQVLSVLDAAHARGVIHRNLTPDNILLVQADPPEIRVRDFGLARLDASGSSDETPVTAANVRVGRLTYMAPEYVETGDASPAVDLYALGVLLFEMLTGVAPPVATYPLPPPSSVRPEVGRMDLAVGRLTAPEPSARAGIAEAYSLLTPAGPSTPPWLPIAVLGIGVMAVLAGGGILALTLLWVATL